MTNRVTKFALAALIFGLAGFGAPANADSSVVYNYYDSGPGHRQYLRAAPARGRYVYRTTSSPVVVERVVTKPVYVRRVVERRVIVHKRHKGLIPKAYSMIFGG